MSISPKSLPIYSLPPDDRDIVYSNEKMAPYSPTPMLPGPITAASPRRSARRVSYTLKNRISRHSLPLSIGLFITTMLLYVTYSGTPSFGVTSGPGSQQQTFNDGGFIRENNGLSFLEEHEDELIAEDDQFWDSHRAKSDQEKKEMAEMESRRKDVEKTNKQHSVRALIWWIAQGGVLPSDYEVPDKETVHKMGSRGMERILEELDNGVPGDEIFQEGWAEFAKDRYQVAVFSKTFCPYSKNAKSILEQYRLTPPPYIIELDRRSDMSKMQTLLQHLTGRRTVPNILLDFESIGGSDDITLVHGEGGLQRTFQEMGALAGWQWKKEKNVKQPIHLEDLDDNIPDDIRAMVEPVVAASEEDDADHGADF